jgi:hypothetical protein
MISVVVDIDDTLINTQRRIWSAWQLVLNREIPFEAVETMGARLVWQKYANSDQSAWNHFWSILLCVDSAGLRLLELDEPVPCAAEILQDWVKWCELIYLTGRPQTSKSLTLDELKKFGFPTENVHLMMFTLEDWENFSSISSSLVETRSRVFSSIFDRHDVVRIVDDDPRYFSVYQKFEVPDRIGLLRPKRFSPEDYLSRGATRVVESWKRLRNDPPKPV